MFTVLLVRLLLGLINVYIACLLYFVNNYYCDMHRNVQKVHTLSIKTMHMNIKYDFVCSCFNTA